MIVFETMSWKYRCETMREILNTSGCAMHQTKQFREDRKKCVLKEDDTTMLFWLVVGPPL